MDESDTQHNKHTHTETHVLEIIKKKFFRLDFTHVTTDESSSEQNL